MKELCGVVREIDHIHGGDVLIIETFELNRIRCWNRWNTLYFKHCRHQPKIGDKVYMYYDGHDWTGSFYPKLDKTLNWQEVGF